MAHQTSLNQPLPFRVPGTAHDASTPAGAPTVALLRCPSCHAEVTSVVEHAIASDRGSSQRVEWTSEASMLSATLRGLKALVVAPSPAPAGAPEPAATEPSETRPRLRVVPTTDATDEAPIDHDVAVVTEPDAPVTGDLALVDPTPARRRRQGFFSRVLILRSFRGERDIARASREHDAAVAGLLDAATGVLSLHHRGLPGRRAEVAHLAVGPAGVLVVHPRLLGDAATASTVRAQVGAVRAVLAAVDLDAVRVDGLLCLRTRDGAATEGDEGDDVRVVAVQDLTAVLVEEGPLTEEHRQTLHELLSVELPARG